MEFADNTWECHAPPNSPEHPLLNSTGFNSSNIQRFLNIYQEQKLKKEDSNQKRLRYEENHIFVNNKHHKTYYFFDGILFGAALAAAFGTALTATFVACRFISGFGVSDLTTLVSTTFTFSTTLVLATFSTTLVSAT
jgi:hypothetical protein